MLLSELDVQCRVFARNVEYIVSDSEYIVSGKEETYIFIYRAVYLFFKYH